jgi:probable addiction module antidote protein
MALKKTNYDKYLGERLKKPKHISGLLSQTLMDDDKRVFLLSMRNVIKANGGFTLCSEKTGITREHLYYLFSEKGNPTLDTIRKILKIYGVSLSITAIRKKLNKAA